ncbi:MAG: S1-like domain-containing RNA-binding protein [Cyclobacteriaceae bacterium]
MIKIGEFNKLKILRETSVGLYLGDEGGEDVLLPNKYLPDKYEIDDLVEVFVYRDHEERKVATNITPKILLHQFALLKVMDVTDVGAFLDWGLEKELFVPFKEQRQKMEVGRWYVVYLDLDIKTDRLFASNKTDKYLQNDNLTVSEGDKVDLIISQKTDLGFSVIVNNLHKGLMFENEIFEKLKVGDKVSGFVKKIREDKKLDISLRPSGYENLIDSDTSKVLAHMVTNDGFLALTDKSTPEEIYKELNLSKKAFKKAIGALYKQRKITIETNGVRLANIE